MTTGDATVRTFTCDYCRKDRPWYTKKDIIHTRYSNGEWCAVMWVCDCTDEGILPDAWCELAGQHDGPVCTACGAEPLTCACGDEEWGGCGKDTCHEQYEHERNWA